MSFLRIRFVFKTIFFEKSLSVKINVRKLLLASIFFFCNTCYKIVPPFLFITKNKSIVHDCEKEMCYRCKKYERNHVCFIKPITSGTKSDNPVLFFSVHGEMILIYCVVQKVCVKCDQKEFVRLSESSKKTGDVKFADANVK